MVKILRIRFGTGLIRVAEHCIEQLRQQVMCAGDVTPITVKYHAPLNKSYVHSDVKHTCRDFQRLQEWMVGRYESQDLAVQELLRNQ
jgi:hypothetical protein